MTISAGFEPVFVPFSAIENRQGNQVLVFTLAQVLFAVGFLQPLDNLPQGVESIADAVDGISFTALRIAKSFETHTKIKEIRTTG